MMATRPEPTTLEAFDVESAAWSEFFGEMRETLNDLDAIVNAMERLTAAPAVNGEES
jgi:hypothetical protein